MQRITNPLVALLAGLFGLLVLSGCGGASSSDVVAADQPGTDQPPAIIAVPTSTSLPESFVTVDPGAADKIIVRISESVNQPDPLEIALGHPTLTLYADGRLEFVDRDRDREPQGIVGFRSLRLDADAFEQYVETALRAAQDPGDHDERIADASRFRLEINGESVRVAWDVARSLDVEAVLGAEVLSESEPVEFTDVLVIGTARAGVAAAEVAPFPADLAFWTEATVRSFAPVRCLRMTGTAATTLLANLAGVSAYGSTWLVDGEPHRIVLRPVFAGEPGCEVLAEL